VDGCIVEKNTGSESSWIESEILIRIGIYLRDHPFGWVFGPENGIQVWPDRPNHVRNPTFRSSVRGSCGLIDP
jgi:hypothetical protein